MKMIKNAILVGIILILIMSVITHAGKTGKITGTVLKQDSNEPVIGSRVTIEGTTLGAMINPMDGSYIIQNIPPGEYTLVASCIGYVPVTVKDVVVQADSITEVNFSLESLDMPIIDSVMVCATPREIDKYETSGVERISSREIESLPVTNLEGIVKMETGIVSHGGTLHKRGSRNGEVGFVDDGQANSGNEPMPISRLSMNMSSSDADQTSVKNKANDVQRRAQQYRWNTESYSRIVENEFKAVTQNPLSTFSIDVDAASYSNVRRFINANSLPPTDAVRLEELINYFDYEYPSPANDLPFSITTELSKCPWNKKHSLVHIGLQGRDIDLENLSPSNLVFLIDVSGSMRPENKLPLLQKSMKLLVEQLRAEDRVAIVTYAGHAGLVLESTPGNQKQKINEAIDRLSAGGCTAGAKGIITAYEVAKRYYQEGGNNRVILATDGDFNIGVSSDAEMTELIESKRDEGIFLTVLGFGCDNLKDSRMEILADKGNGNYAYIDNLNEAKKVLVHDLRGTLFTIAKDVKIQIEFNPMRVKAYRLLGYENRILAKEDFNDDTKDAGELGCGHTVTALYEIIPSLGDEKLATVDDLKYQVVMVPVSAIDSPELMNIKLRYKQPDGNTSKLIEQAVLDQRVKLSKTSDNFRFSASVAEWGMLLRNSAFKADGSYDQVLDLAKDARGDDSRGYRAEFIELVKKSREISEVLAGK